MYTEYVFDDKKYEVASNNLKSILFDIVNAEGSKLADIRQKVAEAEDSGLKEQLIDLCNRQEVVLLRVLNISNHLTRTIQSLDSFSRDVKTVENQSLAEIVSHYVDQQKGTEAKNDKTPVEEKQEVVEETKDAVSEVEAPQIVSSTEEAVTEVTPKQEEVHDEGVHEIVQEDAKEVEEIPEEPVLQNVEENGQVFSQDLMEKDENDEVKEEIVNIFQQDQDSPTEEVKKTENQTDSSEVVEEPVIESSTEEVVENETPVEKQVSEEPVVDSNTNVAEIVQNENEDVSAPEEPKIEGTSEEVASTQEKNIASEDTPTVENVNGEETGQSEVAPENVKIGMTDVPAVDNLLNTYASSDEVVDNNVSVEEQASEDVQNSVLPSIVEPTNNNENINSDGIENESSCVFEKMDTADPKVILTTQSQVSKLRASRDGNESILTAKQFFKTGGEQANESSMTNPLAENNLVFPEELIKEETAAPSNEMSGGVFVQEPVSDDQNLTQELSKEEQMEQMMQQITELYKDGKVDEAQALSDKVSELNRELQQNQKVLAA